MIGWAISWVSISDDSRVTPMATRAKGIRAARSAAMISSTSPASRVRTPSTARTCWMGMETETTRLPFSDTRMSVAGSPRRARPTSSARAWRAASWARVGFLKPRSMLKVLSPGFLAGGNGLASTRSATT